jgi:hypothetical protein
MIDSTRVRSRLAAAGLVLLTACLDKPTTPPAIPAPIASITVGGPLTGSLPSIPVIVLCDDPSTPGCVLTITGNVSAPIVVVNMTFPDAPTTGTFAASDANANATLDVSETLTPGSGHWNAHRPLGSSTTAGDYTLLVGSVDAPVVQNGRRVYVIHATLDASLAATGSTTGGDLTMHIVF